jgi:CO dehydrogenase/acetyl-CoA synthase delta subunit
MPGKTHDRFVALFTRVFDEKLKRAATTPKAEEFCKLIEPRLGSEINLATQPPTKFYPDASYAVMEQEYPGLVIEVSHSQNRKDLEKHAKKMIVMSDCEIAMVIGFDIDYPNSKAVTYSVWRRHRPQNADGGFDYAVHPDGPRNVVFAFFFFHAY